MLGVQQDLLVVQEAGPLLLGSLGQCISPCSKGIESLMASQSFSTLVQLRNQGFSISLLSSPVERLVISSVKTLQLAQANYFEM